MCSRNACRYMHIVCIPLYFSHCASFPCRERAGEGGGGFGQVWRAAAAVLPLLFWFLFFSPPCFLFVLYLFSLVACYALFPFLFSVASSITYLSVVPCVFPL